MVSTLRLKSISMAMLVNLKSIDLKDLSSNSIFQSEFWAKVKAPLWQPFAFSFTIGEKRGDILILVRSFSRFFSIAYVPYGPELALDNKELVALAKALKEELPRSVFLLRFDLPYSNNLKNEKPFHLCLESVQADATVRIDLEHDYSLHSRAKRNISKTKDVFKIEIASTEQDIELWYKAYVETGLRDGFQTRSLSYIKKVLSLKGLSVSSILYLAKKDNVVMGGILNLRGREEELYLFGATIKTEEGLSPGYILQKTAMDNALQAGIKYYDMFGISGLNERGEHLKSLTLFKTAFGGQKYYRTPSFDYYFNTFLAVLYRFFERIRYSIYRKKN